MMECEFVAAYIILWNQWHSKFILGAKRAILMGDVESLSKSCFCCHKLHEHQFPRFNVNVNVPCPEYPLYKVPGISFCEKELDRLKENNVQSILDVFRKFMLRNVPNFVNQSILQWRRGNRPFIVRFDIPSPREVLQMMTRGARCLTVFVEAEEMSRLYKDDYPPFKARNAMEFTFHDLQHMERFMESYEEQIGFLGKIGTCYPLVMPDFACDESLERDFIHLLSDMNAPCLLLFKFFRSKCMEFVCRQKGKLRLDDDEFGVFLETFARSFTVLLGSDVLQNFISKKSMNLEECKLFTSFFSLCGQTAIKKQII